MLTLGTAATDGSGFEALGGDATLVPGAQGGFHIWLKYRISGMAPETVKVHRESRRVSDDALVLLADGSVDVGAAGEDGWWQLPAAQPSFMCPTPIGIGVIDERMVFEVTHHDRGGRAAGEVVGGSDRALPRRRPGRVLRRRSAPVDLSH